MTCFSPGCPTLAWYRQTCSACCRRLPVVCGLQMYVSLSPLATGHQSKLSLMTTCLTHQCLSGPQCECLLTGLTVHTVAMRLPRSLALHGSGWMPIIFFIGMYELKLNCKHVFMPCNKNGNLLFLHRHSHMANWCSSVKIMCHELQSINKGIQADYLNWIVTQKTIALGNNDKKVVTPLSRHCLVLLLPYKYTAKTHLVCCVLLYRSQGQIIDFTLVCLFGVLTTWNFSCTSLYTMSIW
jgi:hypothetical protein